MIDKYSDLKKKYPEHLLLFKHERDYIAINADAHKVSSILNTEVIHNGIAETILPYYRLDWAITKLVKSGLNVAIVE